jgi:hypothetical protein
MLPCRGQNHPIYGPQPEDRQSAWLNCTTHGERAGRRGDRIGGILLPCMSPLL